jgi:hypothetical protein
MKKPARNGGFFVMSMGPSPNEAITSLRFNRLASPPSATSHVRNSPPAMAGFFYNELMI